MFDRVSGKACASVVEDVYLLGDEDGGGTLKNNQGRITWSAKVALEYDLQNRRERERQRTHHSQSDTHRSNQNLSFSPPQFI